MKLFLETNNILKKEINKKLEKKLNIILGRKDIISEEFYINYYVKFYSIIIELGFFF